MKLTNNHMRLYKSIKARISKKGSGDITEEELLILTKDEWDELKFCYRTWNGKEVQNLTGVMVVNFIDQLLFRRII